MIAGRTGMTFRLSTLLFAGIGLALASAGVAPAAEPVTVDNFKRAETHYYMQDRASAGCFAKLCHERAPKAVNEQNVVRLNRDTIYSSGVFDLTTPLTITLPDPKGRFQSLLVINEDHYNPLVTYGPTTVTLTQESAGSRYVFLAFRTFIDPNDPKDMDAAHRLQDAIKVEQASPGKLDLPDWDAKQREELRNGLRAIFKFQPAAEGRFGKESQVDPVHHLIATAGGWGGNPLEAAMYITRTPDQNDGVIPYTLTMKDVPVDGFWSVIVYNAEGFYEAPETSISANSVTAKKNSDGSATIHFGGDPSAPNYLRIMAGWNYTVRLYRPRQDAITGKWTVPDAIAVK
jgi:hypothetical protein